jgi:hypothetical protein
LNGKTLVSNDTIAVVRDGSAAEALYFEVASKKLTVQFHDIEVIDGRASTLFSIGSTILPITAGLLTTRKSVLDDTLPAKVFLFLGFLCYILLTTTFVWSFRYSKWDSRPDKQQWKDVTPGRREDELHRWLGDAYVEAYANNEPVLERKAGKLGLSLWFLAGEAACLTTAVLAPLWPPY